MGQFFNTAPVPAGFRCTRGDYGPAAKVSLMHIPAPITPLLELSRLLRSFPATLSLSVSTLRKSEGKGGLNNVR